MAGEKAHRTAGEPLCEPCREEKNRRNRERDQKNKPWLHVNPDDFALACEVPTARNPKGRRGTYTGWQAHRKRGEESCEECVKARREYGAKRFREWYEANPEAARERVRKYKEENWGLVREKGRLYYQENKTRYRSYHRLREIRLTEIPYERYSDQDVTEAHGTTCYLCLTEVDLSLEPMFSDSPHLDHVHPISDENTPGDVLSNVRWTHAKCNLSKGDKFVDELELPMPAPDHEQWGLVESKEVIAN